jgi:chorismate mutase
MIDLTRNPLLDEYGALMDKIARAKALKQELDILREKNILDDHQYNALLNSNVDIVEKILPKIYEKAIKEMELQYQQQIEEQKAKQPQYQVEMLKSKDGTIKMIVYDPTDPINTLQEKVLHKTEAKKVVEDLKKKYKTKVVGNKVVFIPPTPEEPIIAKDLPGVDTAAVNTAQGRVSGGGRQAKGKKFKKLAGNILSTLHVDEMGNLIQTVYDPTKESWIPQRIGRITEVGDIELDLPQQQQQPVKQTEQQGDIPFVPDFLENAFSKVKEFFSYDEDEEDIVNYWQQQQEEQQPTNPFEGWQ